MIIAIVAGVQIQFSSVVENLKQMLKHYSQIFQS